MNIDFSDQGMVALVAVLAVLIVAFAVWFGTRDGKRGRAKSNLEKLVDDHELQLTGLKKLVANLEGRLNGASGVIDANQAAVSGLREEVAKAGLKIRDLETAAANSAARLDARLDRQDQMLAVLTKNIAELAIKQNSARDERVEASVLSSSPATGAEPSPNHARAPDYSGEAVD